MNYTVRLLGPDDAHMLQHVAPDVFDNDVDPGLAAEFLNDSRHHIAVAFDGETVVGMASALHYVHPDKQPELWIDEVAVAPTHWRRGLGRQMLHVLFAHAHTLGCTSAWVLTDYDNLPARGLYGSAGGVESPKPVLMVEFNLAGENQAPAE